MRTKSHVFAKPTRGLVSTTLTFKKSSLENQRVAEIEKRQINLCGELTAQLGLDDQVRKFNDF
jgi:hypothetical protein